MPTDSESRPVRTGGSSTPKAIGAGGAFIRPDEGRSATDHFPLDDRTGVRGVDLDAARGVLQRVLGRCGDEHWTAIEFGPQSDLKNFQLVGGAWVPLCVGWYLV
jgi:hypothetical protein